jgi:alpha-L-fucosidase
MISNASSHVALSGAFALVAVGAMAAFGLAEEKSKRPAVKKLGTLDCDMVETSPVVFNDRLYRFESVRPTYHGNQTGNSYFRFLDVEAGNSTPPFAKGFHLGSAFVDGDAAYAFGVNEWGGSRITVFKSKDLSQWEHRVAFEAPGWGLYNTSVCKAGDRYVMALEVGHPPEVVGVGFTIFFAESKDLLTWKLLPTECVYAKEKYTACPTLRFHGGHYYMVYLKARPGPSYESHIVRSKDLIQWESSPLNPVLAHSEEDKRIANLRLTEVQRERIVKARNVNNSDLDFCEYKGKTIVYYSWGNQQGTEFLAEGMHDGKPTDFLRGFFP